MNLENGENEEPILTFGVISDFQFTESSQLEFENLKAALTKFKERNIKVLIVAGDIANAGETIAYEKFNYIFNDVYPDSLSAPKKVLIMGNHDYWNGMTVEKAQQNFTHSLGTPLNTHIVVEGYHFIGVSTEGDYVHGVFTKKSKVWLKNQLEQAAEEDPKKPIFVTFHQHIKNTVYLSDVWGNDSLDEILKYYPQVITFSGHSHAVLDDERSIYQKDYTSVGTSTLSYVELEYGKENGSVPPRANEVSQGIIGKITYNAVLLERYDFHSNCKIKTDWVLDLPINKSDFKYTHIRSSNVKAPYFEKDSKITASNITECSFTITFDQAKHDDFTQSYRIQIYDIKKKETKKDFLVFSDFYLGLQRMETTLSYNINGLEENTNYEVYVSGIESFGKESKPISLKVSTLKQHNKSVMA